ncbi:GNAT family N-acetyltransferase [Vagococcus fluvialis]|uniref:GNAT family N-acetyltransferase n=1 Tax=Vagococcus fluvialis TaxID=2738 RepID=UPI001D0A52DA|nr:GNAT family N-acetyltransferase [Vagococcus fluvialis]UDM79497.1 GNAT family N-acetyltransferase [Vagococcus fluvialis]
MIEFRDITRDNFDECLFLEVAEEQEDFVASTRFSLAEAKIFTENIPLAVYAQDTMVGFIMYGLDPDDNEYWISRLLIDEKFQKRGYGKQAMEQILILINETYQPQKLLLSFEPENIVAEKLYLSLGFKHTGRIIDDELVLEYYFK